MGTMAKRLTAWLFAVLVAALMVPGMAFAADLQAGSTLQTQADEDVAFTVYEGWLTGYDADGNALSDYKAAKTYTAEEFAALATDKTVRAYAYKNTVYATNEYVTVDALLKDAGIAGVADNETLRFVDGTKYSDWKAKGALKEYWNAKGGNNWGYFTGAELKADSKFFPNYVNGGDQRDADGAVDAPAVLAINYNAKSIDSNGTAAAALQSITTYTSDDGKKKRYQFFRGESAEEYAASGLLGGFKFPSYNTGIIVYRNSLENATIGDIAAQTYTGKALQPAVTVKFEGGSDLVKDTDYTVDYKSNVNAGTATVTVTGKGGYTGTLSKTFTIAPAKITAATAANATYNGKAQKPALTVKAGSLALAASDYTVAYKDNTKAGKATATVTGKGNYTGTATATFTIAPAKITAATAKGVTYNGKAQKPALTVKAGSLALAASDYTVAYKNNTKAGKATATVTGKGNYTGTTTATFSIAKASQAISAKNVSKTFKAAKKTKKLAKAQTINVKKVAKVSAKTTVKYTKANKAGGAKIAVNAKTGKITAKKGLKKGTYKVKVKLTAAANANYKAAKAKTITVTVKVK